MQVLGLPGALGAACLSAALIGGLGAQPRRVAVEPVLRELSAKLDFYLSGLAENGFSGVVLVAQDGKISFAKGYGLADRERRIPFTTETVFDVGSITKQFTAAAILKLEMQGRLRVTDPLPRFFRSGVPDDKKGITLHHLLTHSAGFADVLGDDYERVTRDEFVSKAFASKLRSVAGKSYHYSNVGYSILGAIVELVAGQTYERFLHDNLFKPAGMLKTGYVIPKWDRDELARGYRRNKDWGTPTDQPWAADGPYWHLRANGGLLSTAGDLERWHRALLDEKVLSKAAMAKYQTPHVREGPHSRTSYGYGWSIGTTPRGTRVIEHNGSNMVFYADIRRYVDDGVVLIFATNAFTWRDMSVPDRLTRLIFKEEEQRDGSRR
jgi:CubicO group peptidase (beta-lactamase class C family)